MSIAALVATLALTTIAGTAFVVAVGTVSELQRRREVSRVLERTAHLTKVAERAVRGEFDREIDRLERLDELKRLATTVFDGVLVRDLDRDEKLAAVYSKVKAALERLSTTSTPAGPAESDTS